MKLIKRFSVPILLLVILTCMPAMTGARVLMTGSVNAPVFSIMPTATFTVDDWLSNPNLWIITVSNTGPQTVTYMVMEIYIRSAQYDPISEGWLRIVGPSKAYVDELSAGQSYLINNTMIQEGAVEMTSGAWSSEFKDEVLRIGYLPEGTYNMRFSLSGKYSDGTSFGDENDPDRDMLVVEEEIDIKNPPPPELVSPDDMSMDVVSIPRFAWQRPNVTDLSMVNNTIINVNYTLRLWKMFGDDGTVLEEEEAINRIPIWELSGLSSEAVDFDPNDSREELISGRKYCWQIQAFDGLGRFISQTNEGKSDVWELTIQFRAPVLSEPRFPKFTIDWTPAQAGGGQVYYRVRIDEEPDFPSPFRKRLIVATSFTYPDDAPALEHGTIYYFEVQTTDDNNIPLGEPVMTSFELPPIEVQLLSPEDGGITPTDTPVFIWKGTSEHYTVTVFDVESDWSYSAVGVVDNRWVYDGEPLLPGATYSWNVTPTNEFNDPIGPATESRTLSLSSETQVTILSPVNNNIDTILPAFSWNEVTAGPGAQVMYRINIMNNNGSVVHSAEVTTTQYTYPEDAEILSYASRYTWTVSAESEGAEVGTVSSEAWFVTPFVVAEGGALSMDALNDAISVVLSGFSEYEAFKGKILAGMSDETGPITPEQLMEIISTFVIVKVSAP